MAITLGYAPHPAQRLIHAARGYRFRVICCGRRFGKTRAAAAELLDLAGENGGTYAWIAPTYFLAEKGEEALQAIAPEVVTFSGNNPRRGRVGTQAEIFFLSSDHPEMILGAGYDGAIVDEAASIDSKVWQQYLRPALADKLGWAIFISSPKGRNWFFDLYTRGRDPAESDYKSFTFPSNKSPFFPPEEWEEVQRTTPGDVFRQEYMAEFLDDSAGVFRGVDACLLDKIPPSTGPVVVAADIAKHTDFTVLTALDRLTGVAFDRERFNHLDWPIQRERILSFAQKHKALLVMDATGVGDAIYDDLRRAYPRIEPYVFTSRSKTELIQRLIVAIERQQVHWPREWVEYTDELKRYEFTRDTRGNFVYNAPEGFHDDCVISLALANFYSSVTNPPPPNPVLFTRKPAELSPQVKRHRRLIYV